MNALLRLQLLKPTVAELDAKADAMLRFVNAERAALQSADTRCGRVAELPSGPSLAGVDAVFARLFGVRHG